ncbi:hypothetical protein, partial [Sinorhizobium medicae]|uniref:hypothetical protein n=1 Tax=Sinorhizobium medicae TaxID=110321 RepID=UPI001AEE2976
ICSSVNLCFFMRPSFNRPDSNPNWRKLPVAGQDLYEMAPTAGISRFGSGRGLSELMGHDPTIKYVRGTREPDDI